ncbi:MAG TPA: amidohydrolase family protein, partial [Pyrinomonadaceae bacterium]|nr:amidohydrolase family protein [Pyrinomonadaceae bacterium]
VLIVHAEVPGPIERSLAKQVNENFDPRLYSTFLQSRPRKAEDEAVALVIRLSRETAARVHIVHHSSSDSLPVLREAKDAGVPVTVETCPHYLAFAAEDVPDGATEFKCCPPVRERENSEKLWSALREGLIDMVVSDHSPCLPEMKLRETGDFLQAWGGISSLQLRLPVMWTLMRERDFSINDLVRLLAHAPARLVRLDGRKGRIAEGFDADFVVWNPDEEFKVEPHMLHHRHKLTPYAGKSLRGKVEATFLRGQKIFERGEFALEASGVRILRGDF